MEIKDPDLQFTSRKFGPIPTNLTVARIDDVPAGTNATEPQLDAALAYVRRGWAVLPVAPNKTPLTAHGVRDAATDEATVGSWWKRWPNALIGVATGRVSGVVALDIDLRPDGDGFASLADMGIPMPIGPTASTPCGGLHIFFRAPDYEVKNSASKIGPYLDVRGDGGYIIVPPGPGRCWDASANLETMPLPPMPEWMVATKIVKQAPHPGMQIKIQPLPSRTSGELTPYGEAALDNAFARIFNAAPGAQEVTLNTESYCIGALVGGGEIPPDLGIGAMLLAARSLPSFDHHRPWRTDELEQKARRAFNDGLAHPKAAPHG